MGARTLVGEYIPSARNAQVADFYERLGFVGLRRAEGPQRWTWDLEAGLPPVPDWFEIVDPARRAPVATPDEFVGPKS